MANELQGKKIAFLATDGVEQVELTEPRKAIEEAGAQVELISLEAGEIQGVNHLDKGDTFPVDRAVADANAEAYDGLVLPGGVANPDFLRMNQDAVSFVRAFFEAGKPVGAICHGPWTLVEAGVLTGRTITSWPSLQTDIRNAGGNWVDQEVVTDRGLVTSRNPGDIPAFSAKLVEEFAEGRHDSQAIATSMATQDASPVGPEDPVLEGSWSPSRRAIPRRIRSPAYKASRPYEPSRTIRPPTTEVTYKWRSCRYLVRPSAIPTAPFVWGSVHYQTGGRRTCHDTWRLITPFERTSAKSPDDSWRTCSALSCGGRHSLSLPWRRCSAS